MRARSAIFAVMFGGISMAGAEASAARVSVFQLEAKGMVTDTAKLTTQALIDEARTIDGIDVVDPDTGREQLGVDLDLQARACEYDVFCLVELGELLKSRYVLVGHLKAPPPTDADADLGLRMELVLVDVSKATVVEILRWRVTELDPDALPRAAAAAVRRLLAARDVDVRLKLQPPDARVHLYGERLDAPSNGEVFRYWSGVYHVQVSADGFQPLERTLRLQPGQVVTEVALELEPDPLYVARKRKSVEVFDKPSRRVGGGPPTPLQPAPTSVIAASDAAYRTAWPWLTVGGGLALTALGAVLMNSAQSSYNELAMQPRYTPGTTVTSGVAMRQRGEHRAQYTSGSAAVLGGVAVVLGAGVWMIVDALGRERTGEQAAVTSASRAKAVGSAAPAPSRSARRAARWLATELHR